MDKKQIIKFQIISTIFIFIFGTILHFTYEWSGENTIVGLFSATNESTWEHLKLLFFLKISCLFFSFLQMIVLEKAVVFSSVILQEVKKQWQTQVTRN